MPEPKPVTPDFARKRALAAERLGIAPEQMPRHVAIIMDGNGRWAKNRGLPRFRGHEQGGKVVEDIAHYSVDLGFECLSLYSFSLQNWKRPQDEVDFLMHLYAMYLRGIQPTLMEHDIRLVHLGELTRLPDTVVQALAETVQLTANNRGLALGLALNYGARAEIVEAVRRVVRRCLAGELSVDEIDEEAFSRHLYTAGLPDPDLLIRTSGELRVSNFLLWQISYAEFYVTETLWPDFDRGCMDDAIRAYAGRSRRFGDIKTPQAR